MFKPTCDIFLEFQNCSFPACTGWLRVLSLLWEKSLSHGKAKCRREVLPPGLFPLWILQHHSETGYVVVVYVCCVNVPQHWEKSLTVVWIVCSPFHLCRMDQSIFSKTKDLGHFYINFVRCELQLNRGAG